MVAPLRTQRGFTIIELMVVVLIIGLLAAIAGPNFLRYQAKSRQAETRANLSGIYVAEMAFYSEMLRFSNANEIGFRLEGMNRYTYRIMATAYAGGVIIPGAVETLNAKVGLITPDNTLVAAAATATSFTVTATANLDNDSTIDQWHVNDIKQGLQLADTDDVIN